MPPDEALTSLAAAADHLPITVVVPAYNRQDFLKEALDSVAAQTKRPAEVVVIDDGSTDATSRIARSAGANVVHQDHLGVSAARNAGVLVAAQPWIAFLDSDDLWLPEKLERQWEAVERCPEAGIVFCDYSVVRDSEIAARSFFELKQVRIRMREAYTSDSGYCDAESLCREFVSKNFIMASAPLIRRDLLTSVGLFNTDLHYCEDYELHLRVLAATKAAVVLKPLALYRFHGSNSSADSMKLRTGMIAVANRVFANPAFYPAVAVDYFRRQQPLDMKQAGISLLRTGRPREARQHLRDSLKRQFDFAVLLAYCSTFILGLGGRPLHSLLRALWRKRPRVRGRGPPRV